MVSLLCLLLLCLLLGLRNVLEIAVEFFLFFSFFCPFDISASILTLQNMLQTGLIIGGWDKYEGGKIYGIPLGGTILEQPFAIGGVIFLSFAYRVTL